MNHKIYFNRVAICLLAGLALVLLVLAAPRAAAYARPVAEEPKAPMGTLFLVVDRSDDTDGLSCTPGNNNDCTLRSAITIANTDSGNTKFINFYTDYTINLGGPLTIYANDLSIVGTTPTGTGLTIKINAGGYGQAFIITGTYISLDGLHIYGAGTGYSNIWIAGSAYQIHINNNVIGDDNYLDGCQVGSSNSYGGIYISATGAPCESCSHRVWISGNVIECNGGSPGNGIDLIGTNDVVIGAYPLGVFNTNDRNSIRSNDGNGINIVSSSTHNHIAYNKIGTNAAGSAAAANGLAGIYVASLSHNTVITGNLISGNTWAGVWLYNAQTITLTNNTIGMNAVGNAAIPNGHDGVAITDGAHHNTIGGFAANDKNYISGNTHCGVLIRDGATYNLIDGNLIGLDGTGTTAIPNGMAGVAVFDANENNIGSSSYGVTQFISGNTREGVYIDDSSGTFIGQTNLIGVASDETTARGNGLQGVMLYGASNTTVWPFIVAHNGGAGVAVVGSTAISNSIISDGDIHGNDGLPIDLGNDGHTENGSQTPPGPNNWLNYPVITGGSGSNASGTACPNCRVYFYEAIGNTLAAGGGGKYLNIIPSIVADGLGNWNVTTLPGGLTRSDITTIACESPCSSTSNTSEMSPFVMVYLPLVLR